MKILNTVVSIVALLSAMAIIVLATTREASASKPGSPKFDSAGHVKSKIKPFLDEC